MNIALWIIGITLLALVFCFIGRALKEGDRMMKEEDLT